ncbi:rod shape-determining protein RodA [Oceanirhabdus sp. W0125-5]|uniref:rod shape-determining protein RodA n=1 Tax=Oceanirhabdus sp. W0125-5 TaxID=2999116 RepID=UPI0022F2ACF1|nr:rod shape-determining protein RodA [Oceanirhabdus sp. W0125-5]WBW95859.1 rod shape-determining protein RodA [Oceanirhabdus sp. W0125-5]
MLHKLNFRINKKLFRYLSYDILIVCSMLVVFGAMNIYSDTRKHSVIPYFKLQMSWLVICLITVGIIILIDYMVIANYAPLIYWASVILLIFNHFMGETVNGATGWISIGSRAIQPAEFAKIGLIIMLAKKLDDMEGKINNFKNFFILCFYAFIPMVLILIQPDMGMTMVCFFTVLGIVFIAGLDLRVIFGGLTGLLGLIVVIWNSPLMKPYWKGRLTAFVNPEAYSRDYSFQLKQSLIGIGSGGVTGLGYGNGSQYLFVPESHTDFIFAVIGEEWGLMGAIFILLLYGYLIVRFIHISKKSKDIFGKIICVGITSSFLFSIFQNMGMTIGLMPVTGITLPLLSYGGSSMLTNFIGIGLILNIGMRRKKINF